MNGEDPKPKPEAKGDRPPPRPPRGTAIGLGPDGDSGKNYLVTITNTAKGEGKFIRSSGGRGHYGHVIVLLEPNRKGGGIEFREENANSIPEEFIKAVLGEIRNSVTLLYDENFRVDDIIVRLIGGSSSKTDSTDLAFRMATIFALKDALKKAGPTPIE